MNRVQQYLLVGASLQQSNHNAKKGGMNASSSNNQNTIYPKKGSLAEDSTITLSMMEEFPQSEFDESGGFDSPKRST
jgi:hypothetical protein